MASTTKSKLSWPNRKARRACGHRGGSVITRRFNKTISGPQCDLSNSRQLRYSAGVDFTFWRPLAPQCVVDIRGINCCRVNAFSFKHSMTMYELGRGFILLHAANQCEISKERVSRSGSATRAGSSTSSPGITNAWRQRISTTLVPVNSASNSIDNAGKKSRIRPLPTASSLSSSVKSLPFSPATHDGLPAVFCAPY